MTIVNVELFEALKKIEGVSEDQAKRAAQGDLSETKLDIKFLKWGLAIVVALVLGLYITLVSVQVQELVSAGFCAYHVG